MIMTPQEKAAAYDKAIERARRMIEDYKNRGLENYIAYAKENIDYIFPELKESEGESMKESLITFFRKYPYSIGDAGINPLDAIAWLEKQGEQKPADKVEPKFKVGEWIIFDENHNSVYQVERIDNYRYYLRHYLGGTLSVHFDNELIRKWTIQDAKDGDVLVMQKTNVTYESIFIFKIIENNRIIQYLHYFTTDADEEVCEARSIDGFLGFVGTNVYPATKEQRDKLEKAMADAGWEFDFDKKELKKIEQPKLTEFEDAIKDMKDDYRDAIDENDATIEEVKKRAAYLLSLIPCKSAWSEEDEKKFSDILAILRGGENCYYNNPILIDWLKSLKDRIRPKVELTQLDKNILEAAIAFVGQNNHFNCWRGVDKHTVLSALHSLRPQNRWKPSDNELEVLRLAAEKDGTILMGLYEQLKKLREE